MNTEDQTRNCPYCNTPCHADFVDIGVGMQQCGPYGCERCGAVEIGPHDDCGSLDAEEILTGWKAPTRDFNENK